MTDIRQGGLEQAICEAIANEVRERAEHIIAGAKADIERQLRDSIASIILSVNRMYSVETVGPDIVIRVKNEVNL